MLIITTILIMSHLMIALANDTDKDIVLQAHERIAQGIFYRYLTTDDDASKEKSVRSGGFGSTTSKEADK